METAAQRIIEQLGGISRLARALGHRNPTTVQGWKARGTIPVRRIPEVMEAARRLGMELSADAFLDIPGHQQDSSGQRAA